MIFDLVQPAVEGGAGDAEVSGDSASGDLEGLDVPEDEQPLVNGISWAPAVSMEVLLQDRDLHFELVDPVFEEEDFLSLGIDIFAGQSFEASPANPSREPHREQGGPDEQ